MVEWMPVDEMAPSRQESGFVDVETMAVIRDPSIAAAGEDAMTSPNAYRFAAGLDASRVQSIQSIIAINARHDLFRVLPRSKEIGLTH